MALKRYFCYNKFVLPAFDNPLSPATARFCLCASSFSLFPLPLILLMLFGAHVSTAGGIENAPINAHKIGAAVFQFFDRSPRGGKPTYTDKSVVAFKQNMAKYKIQECYIHTPYYINLASAENRIRYGSISVIREELESASRLGAQYVMTHLGSAKDFSRLRGQADKEALALVVDGINKILDGYAGTAELLIENSAGAGQIIGDDFKEIGFILKKIKSKNVGVCLDTCHAFASGYDFRTRAAVDKTLEQFDRQIGLDKLKLFHLNDSKTELGSHKDRHADIGFGFLKQAAFAAIAKHSKLKDINAVIETPEEEMSYKKTIDILKQLL